MPTRAAWCLPILLAAGCAAEDFGEPVDETAFAISADERLDPAFGDGGRVALREGEPYKVVSSVLRSDGKTVYSGEWRMTSTAPVQLPGGISIPITLYIFPQWSVGRLTAAGAADPQWNGGKERVLHADLGGAFTSEPGSVVDAGSKVYAVATVYKNNKTRGVLARLSSNGTPDTAYGTSGFKWLDAPGFASTRLTWAERDHEGRLLVGGAAWNGDGTQTSAVLARLLPSGALDTSYSGDGWAVKTLPAGEPTPVFTLNHDRGYYRSDNAVYFGVRKAARVYEVLDDGSFGNWVWNEFHDTPKAYVQVPQLPTWKPQIVDITAGENKIFVALNPGMGIGSLQASNGDIEGTSEDMGVYKVPGLEKLTSRGIYLDEGTERLVLVGDGETASGQKRAAVVLSEPVYMKTEKTFHEDGRVVTNFLTLSAETVNHVFFGRERIVIAASEPGNGAALARYRVAAGKAGQPCHFDAGTGEQFCDTGLMCPNYGADVCVAPPDDDEPPAMPQPEPDPPPTPEPDPDEPPVMGGPQPEPCIVPVAVHTNGCTDFVTGQQSFLKLCAYGCASTKAKAEEMAKAALQTQTCLGEANGCCKTVTNTDFNSCGYLPDPDDE